jgi:hypothetical protein
MARSEDDVVVVMKSDHVVSALSALTPITVVAHGQWMGSEL